MGKPTIVSRTGYTGEDGLELIVRAEDASRVWENLLLAGREVGLQPAGLGARDTLRLEAGMPLYGHELEESIDPFQAGLDFAVQGSGRHFIGSESLTRIRQQVRHSVRVGLKLDGMRAARQGAVVFDAQSQKIGVVTSGSHAPTLNQPIAMGYVAAAAAQSGQTVEVDIRGSRVSAKICDLPFYRRKTSKP
jgi:aminomethyltransferase